MNYSALIQNRKSIRAFSDQYVPFEAIDTIKDYHRTSARRLVREIKTELRMFGLDARAALEGAAGYKQFLIGAPQYMVLLSEAHPQAAENAGFVMEDLILKATDMGLDTCWLTFTNSEYVKTALEIDSPLEVAAIAAFGYGQKTNKRLRINVRSMSNVDLPAQRQYFAPKKGVADLVFMERWDNYEGVEEFIGFYDALLWEAFYAASLAPSYLNRQPYGFVIRDGSIILVQAPDSYTDEKDGKLSLGAAMSHFSAVAQQWGSPVSWNFAPPQADLPEGFLAVAAVNW